MVSSHAHTTILLDKAAAENERLKKEASFQMAIHKSELKSLQKHLQKYDENEVKDLLKYHIPRELVTVSDDTKVLGRGGQGVIKAASMYGESVAIKIVTGSSMLDNFEELLEDFFRELRLTAPLHHENVIDCIGGCWPEALFLNQDDNDVQVTSMTASMKLDAYETKRGDLICLVLELAARGDLAGFISRGIEITLPILVGTGESPL